TIADRGTAACRSGGVRRTRPHGTGDASGIGQRSHHAVSGKDVTMDRAYKSALAMIHTGRGDAMATIEQALHADPHFVSGHCLRAALLVMACRDDARRELTRTLEAAQASIHRADERERRHLAAAAAWLENDLKRALNLYGEILADYPHDTLALRVAHFGDLQWSRTERLRDRVAAVLPHWHEGIEGYAHVLAMYAFGLAEAGD